jgi:hypothetical protein
MTPILFSILEEIARLIALIRKGDDHGAGTQGYFFDWNPTNVFDTARMQPGPNASLYFMGEQPLNEEEGGNNGGLYENLADFKIEVQYLYDAPPENPQWTGQRDILCCQEDLKRFIDHKREALGALGLFDICRPKDIRPEIIYSTDATNPAKLMMPWRIQYSQPRREPELFG